MSADSGEGEPSAFDRLDTVPGSSPETSLSTEGDSTVPGEASTADNADATASTTVEAAPPRTVKRRPASRAGAAKAGADQADPEVGAAEAGSEADGASDVGAEPGSETVAEATLESAEEQQARESRIEVPVPSVQRARERAAIAVQNPVVLRTEDLTKIYGDVLAAGDVSFDVHAGSFTGVVGPNGAGKTTVLSMISGLNRPTSGRITVHGVDVWADGPKAKRLIGTLPDRLRLFDRLTGAQLLYYAGVLQGVDEATVASRVKDLAQAFGLESALDRLVGDYSAGMQKKIGLACAMIHAPDLLVLDEPFEAIDPVSASNVTEILEKYVAGGGSVVMSSHSLDLIQRICDHVAVIVDGSVIAQGTVDAVRDGISLEERFKHLTQASESERGLEWLHGSSDSE